MDPLQGAVFTQVIHQFRFHNENIIRGHVRELIGKISKTETHP
jgi:hypothetical protein